MPTSADPDIAFPRLPRGKLLQVSVHPKLFAVAARIEQQYGPPRATAAQPESVLKRAATKLVQSDGNLALLTHRERKAAVELCWVARDGWMPRGSFVREWLKWAEFGWNSRAGISRIAVSYVRNYDEDAEATGLVGSWLGARQSIIGDQFGDVFRHYGLLDGLTAVSWIAQSLAEGSPEFFARIDADTKSSAVFQGSGTMVAVMAEYGARCAAPTAREVAGTARSVIGHVGENGLGGKASQRSRDVARVSMVVGMVSWAARNGGQEAIDAAIAACLSLAGDPRHAMGMWRDIPSKTVELVHGWLTARTIENMFLVIDTLKTDHPDQVASRLAFWREYLPHIRRAYLVCAKRAKPVAERLKEPYGHLDSNDPAHCGLLMEIVALSGDRIIAMEINKNASALFWKSNSKWQLPDFYGPGPYPRPTYLNACDRRISHTGNWQKSFSDFISGETGIRHSAGENVVG
jgi:hypothetical protein